MTTEPAAGEDAPAEFDTGEFDIVVAGSGAAGMTAALAAAHLGASAVVLEKAGAFGGTTARSGGGVWAPGNTVLRRAGVADTPELAAAYLAHVTDGHAPAELRGALLEHGPAMLDLVLATTPLRFAWVPGYADYYPEAPGGLASGRSIEPVPLAGTVLDGELARLNRPYLPVPDGVAVTQADYRWLSLGPRHPRALLAGAKVAGRAARSRLLGHRMLSLGQALAAGLRAGLIASDVPVWLNTPLTGLVMTDGRVTGVRVVRDGKPTVIRAKRGVLIATGGFERNADMRRQYQRSPIGTDWTTGAVENTGDGIVAGQELGAATGLMDDAWWGPAIPLPGGPFFCLAERSLPGCVLVNGAGRRFVNESAPYVDAVHAMYDGNTAENPHIPAWLIFDQRYRDTYVFAGRPPRRPLPRRWYAAGAVFRAADLAGLGAAIGVSPGSLAKTVARFNEFARSGRDEDFRRGDSAYDRYYGDPRCRPNPNLAPLVKPPFYAVKIVPGDLGTKGGLRTDARARVLRTDGSAIPGLYAAGNASASVMGHSYAGAGATIGPAMTFGYIAALDLSPGTAEASLFEINAVASLAVRQDRADGCPVVVRMSSGCPPMRLRIRPLPAASTLRWVPVRTRVSPACSAVVHAARNASVWAVIAVSLVLGPGASGQCHRGEEQREVGGDVHGDGGGGAGGPVPDPSGGQPVTEHERDQDRVVGVLGSEQGSGDDDAHADGGAAAQPAVDGASEEQFLSGPGQEQEPDDDQRPGQGGGGGQPCLVTAGGDDGPHGRGDTAAEKAEGQRDADPRGHGHDERAQGQAQLPRGGTAQGQQAAHAARAADGDGQAGDHGQVDRGDDQDGQPLGAGPVGSDGPRDPGDRDGEDGSQDGRPPQASAQLTAGDPLPGVNCQVSRVMGGIGGAGPADLPKLARAVQADGQAALDLLAEGLAGYGVPSRD